MSVLFVLNIMPEIVRCVSFVDVGFGDANFCLVMGLLNS